MTSPIRSYRDLIVWQRAMELADRCHHLTRGIPSTKSSALGSQIQRATASIPANIAEGTGRRSRADYLRHLSIANGSLLELESHLLLAERIGALSPADVASVLAICSEVGRMLAVLMRRLRESRRPEPRAPPA
jgi:four helix bundle protein